MERESALSSASRLSGAGQRCNSINGRLWLIKHCWLQLICMGHLWSASLRWCSENRPSLPVMRQTSVPGMQNTVPDVSIIHPRICPQRPHGSTVWKQLERRLLRGRDEVELQLWIASLGRCRVLTTYFLTHICDRNYTEEKSFSWPVFLYIKNG